MSPTSENDNNARKRVCKACDRCRLKKSKVQLCLRLAYLQSWQSLPSAMALALVIVVGPIMRYVFLENAKSRTTKFIRKGSFATCLTKIIMQG